MDSLNRAIRRTLALGVAVFSAPFVHAGTETMIRFDIPEGRAFRTLKQFARQAGLSIVYDARSVEDVPTNEVVGLLPPTEALRRLLNGTQLHFNQDHKTGAIAVRWADVTADSSVAGTHEPPIDSMKKTTAPSSQNTSNPVKKRTLLAGLAALLAGAPGNAQAPSALPADAEADEDIVELSPFSIVEDKTVGYQATSTLSGTRIRSNLADIAGSISVVTREFLEDTGSNNARDLLVYTTGTEVTGSGGNLTGYGINAGNVNDDNTLATTVSENRVRGLAAADYTRDYFLTSIPFDSYNTSRVEINRGSNAVLFGLGSPAGIINASLNKAILGRVNEVGFTVDRFGSTRTTVDFNHEVIENELAVRFAAVKDDREFEQDPAFEDTTRYYFTATFSKDLIGSDNAWGRTTFRASYEDGEIDSNRPRTLPPTDLVTPWFDPYTDSVLGSVNMVARPTWDAFTGSYPGSGETGSWRVGVIQDPNSVMRDNPRIQVYLVDSYSRAPAFTFEDEKSSVPSDPAGGNIIGRQGSITALNRHRWGAENISYPNYFFFGVTTLQNALIQWRGTAASPGGVDFAGFFNTPLVEDDSVFNFRSILLDGPNKREGADFDVKNASIEQLLFDDKVGFEIAYAKEKFEEDSLSLVNSAARRGMGLDLQVRLADGTVNDNFGRPYVVSQPGFGYSRTERENIRATAFGNLDFTEKDGWQRWLGRHVLTGLISSLEENSFSEDGEPWVWGESMIYGANTNPFNAAGRRVGSIHYLGGSLAERSTSAGANIPGIQANQHPSPEKLVGGLFRVYPNNPGLGGSVPLPTEFSDQTFPIFERYTQNANLTRNKYDSTVLVLQSFLLDDLLVGTYSWRKDEFDVRTNGNPPSGPDVAVITDPSVFNLDNLPDSNILVGDEQNTTWGVVAKVPSSWVEGTRFISGLQFHYGESSNFQPAGNRTNSVGGKISSPSGETQDYGFTLRLMNDRLNIKAIWYETNQKFVNSRGGAPAHSTFAEWHARILNAADSEIAGGGPSIFVERIGQSVLVDHDQNGTVDFTYYPPDSAYLARHGFSYEPNVGARIVPDSTYANVEDVAGKGFELEVVYNPTANWRFILNASKQQAVTTGAGEDLLTYFSEYPLYDIDGDGTAETSAFDALGLGGPYDKLKLDSAGQNLMYTTLRNFVQTPLSTLTVLNGQRTPEIREWRANLITNYSFAEGRLKGFNVGGAVRWEKEGTIGYALGQEPESGVSILDVNEPIFGDSNLRVDAWIGYQTRLMDGKVDWGIQLNIRNLLNDDDLIPVVANPDGRVVANRIPVPLTWEIRNTFAF